MPFHFVSTRFFAFLFCLLAVSPPASTAVSRKPVDLPRASISPSIIYLAPGGECHFKVVLGPQRLAAATLARQVTWSVNGLPGGSDSTGTIDQEGLYHAPQQAPQSHEIHICANSEEAANPHLWATVLIGDRQPGYELVSKWEEPANGSSHLKAPSGIAIEKDGNLLISDASCSQVFRFSPKGELLGTIGLGTGNTMGHLDSPRSLVVDSTGTIYVSDLRTGPPRIQAFHPDGTLFHAFAKKGTGPGQVMEVRAMTLDPLGRLLAADVDNMRISLFTTDGTFIANWDSEGTLPGQFNEPYGLFADSNADVFVASYYGPCQKFNTKGKYLLSFAQPDPPDGPVILTSMTGDRWGNIYLAVRDTAGMVHNSVHPEPRTARVMKFNNNGDLTATIPLWDDERGENAMAVDSQDRLHILFQHPTGVGVAVFEPR